jgi:hypothetical protein
MVVFGLALIGLGVILVLTALLSGDGTAEMLGNDLTALTIFLLGLAAGAAILWGVGVLRYGAKRSLERRREHRQLTELSEKLDRVEHRDEGDDRR